MYVIAGVSGKTGRVVADVLIGRRLPVRVVVRDAAKGRIWAERGAAVAVADLEDGGALLRALQGAWGAYLLIPPTAPGGTGIVERGRRLAAGMKHAVEKSGVGHVVFLSSVGADRRDSGIVGLLHHAEEELGSLDTRLTFLRAAYFLENWGTSLRAALQEAKLPTFITPDRVIGMVASRDVGRIAAHALLEPPASREIIDVAGPVDYRPIDIARILGELLSRRIRAEAVPLDQMVAALQGVGVSAELAELYREFAAGLNDGRLVPGGGRLVRGGTAAAEVLGGLLRIAAAL